MPSEPIEAARPATFTLPISVVAPGVPWWPSEDAVAVVSMPSIVIRPAIVIRPMRDSAVLATEAAPIVAEVELAADAMSSSGTPAPLEEPSGDRSVIAALPTVPEIDELVVALPTPAG